MNTQTTLTLLVSFTTLTAACATDPSQPTDHLQIYETCLETDCDQYVQSGNEACSACTSACIGASYDCDPTTACSDSCADRQCDDAMRSDCIDKGYKVTLPNNPDSAVRTACSAALGNITQCGYMASFAQSDCTRYAAVDVDSDTAIFNCIAQLGCSSLGDMNAFGACLAVQPSTWGDNLCAQLAQQCPSNACSSSMQSSLDLDGAEVRQDALDAAMTCLSQPSCDEIIQCLSAWRTAVE